MNNFIELIKKLLTGEIQPLKGEMFEIFNSKIGAIYHNLN